MEFVKLGYVGIREIGSDGAQMEFAEFHSREVPSAAGQMSQAADQHALHEPCTSQRARACERRNVRYCSVQTAED